MCVVPLIVVVARNVVALLQGILKRRVAKGIDIIGMSSMSVNSVLVIIKSLARIQATAVEGKQRWVGEGWTKGMNDPILRTRIQSPCYEPGHGSHPG